MAGAAAVLGWVMPGYNEVANGAPVILSDNAAADVVAVVAFTAGMRAAVVVAVLALAGTACAAAGPLALVCPCEGDSANIAGTPGIASKPRAVRDASRLRCDSLPTRGLYVPDALPAGTAVTGTAAIETGIQPLCGSPGTGSGLGTGSTSGAPTPVFGSATGRTQ